MRIKPTRRDAYQLIHDGAIAFARMEGRGIRIDTEFLNKSISETENKIRKYSEKLKTHKIYKRMRKRFGEKTKLGSREQLSKILFEEMGFEVTKRTATGQPAADVEHLNNVDSPFVRRYIEYQKLIKMNSTYLKGIRRETVNGFCHPFFNLHTVITYRSSSDSPNFQNMPLRDPKIGNIVRRCVTARPNHYFVEIDFSGIEVRVAACYHKDPRMMKYIKDDSTDMHRDMAAQIYKLETEQVDKAIRQSGKNLFVFPQFYGDYYINCAKNMWGEIGKRGLALGKKDLYRHLSEKGIGELGAVDPEKKPKPGTFEYHMKKVEEDFWKRRFKVYGKWKKWWWDKYLERGHFDFYTGFRSEGIFKRNEVINSPIQGSAFHCLLWSLIQLMKAMQKRKMKSMVIGQIHDSIVADVRKDEFNEYIELANDIMTRRLLKHWPWIITPIEVEVEASPLNGAWSEKEEIEL